ncbi:hypothetical protein BJX62DRAFT_196979 [Aspergillus germanicus]
MIGSATVAFFELLSTAVSSHVRHISVSFRIPIPSKDATASWYAASADLVPPVGLSAISTRL